jgi:hypothetical protein
LLIVRDGAARLSKCVQTSSGGCPEYRRRRDYGRVPLIAAAVELEVLGFWDCCGAGGQEVPSSGAIFFIVHFFLAFTELGFF